MEERFLELAKNKDITDEELFEEVCYVYEKSKHHDSKRIFFEKIRFFVVWFYKYFKMLVNRLKK
jgi:hypothetical protein